jgi:hypothetical protein
MKACSDHIERDFRCAIWDGLDLVHGRVWEQAPSERSRTRGNVDDARVRRFAQNRYECLCEKVGTCRIDIEGVTQTFSLCPVCGKCYSSIVDENVEFTVRFGYS